MLADYGIVRLWSPYVWLQIILVSVLVQAIPFLGRVVFEIASVPFPLYMYSLCSRCKHSRCCVLLDAVNLSDFSSCSVLLWVLPYPLYLVILYVIGLCT